MKRASCSIALITKPQCVNTSMQGDAEYHSRKIKKYSFKLSRIYRENVE